MATKRKPVTPARGAGAGPDWDGIERDYRSGLYTAADLATAYGVSESAISKRAKRHRWVRGELKGAIAQSAQQKVAAAAVAAARAMASAPQAAPAAPPVATQPATRSERDAAIVDEYGSVLAQMLGEHKDQARAGRMVSKRLIAEVEFLLEQSDQIKRRLLESVAAAAHAPKAGRKNRRPPDVVALILLAEVVSNIADVHRKVAQSTTGFIELERQAAGLGRENGDSGKGGSWDELIREAESRGLLA